MENSVRKNTVVFAFDKETRRVQPTTLEIDDWITQVLGINPDSVHTAQLDSDNYCVFVKFLDAVTVDRLLSRTGKHVEYVHRDGTKSKVSVKRAGSAYKTVRVLNVPIEVDNGKIRDALAKYGEVKEIFNERWSKQYKLQCFNGVRSVEMEVKTNIPSYISVEGQRAHIVYSGQTPTCHVCNEADHLRQDCPRRAVVLKNNLMQRRKLTLNEVLATANSDHQADIPNAATSLDDSSLDGSAFPPLPTRSSQDSSSRDSDVQNKKRPIALTDEHVDDDTCSSPAIRKQKSCSDDFSEKIENMQEELLPDPSVAHVL